ncbi:MAG: hypothetical protein K6C68_02190 [Ruminococcus sp.]|nr:hypothetical protein [Ruminococcus sp.]
MRNQKMDSIKIPDLKNLNQRQQENISSYDRYSRAEDPKGRTKVSFDSATRMQEIDTILQQKHQKKDEVQQMLDDFQSKRRNMKAPGVLDQGVKIRGTYVARRRIITAVVTFILLLLLVVFFLPPIFKANDTESSCRSEDIFADGGVNGYKIKILKDKSVYNLDGMDSEKSSSYRICTVAFEAHNLSPFAAYTDNYQVVGGGEYKDHIIYCAAADDESKEIPPFGKKTVKVEILVNRSGLTDTQFDRAVTSLTIATRGLKRRESKNGGLPCIPAFMGVSDIISFDPGN